MAKYATSNIRTIALVGHGASGKTTLAEALLVKSGALPAGGSVERGTTASDFDPLEKSYQHSLRSSLLHFETNGTRVHLIDTPGFPDFIGQSIGALDAVETAAVVVNAQAGIEMITSRMMDWAAKRQLCRLVIINKIDAENVDLPGLLAGIQAAFGKECLPINLPAGDGKRVVDCFFNPSGESDFSSVADAHRALVDQVVEVDEELMSLYLEQGEISRRPAARAVREGAARRPSRAGVLRVGAYRRGRRRTDPDLRKAAAEPDRRQSAALHQGRRRGRGRLSLHARFRATRSRACVQGRHGPVRGQARDIPRAPGHRHARHAALRRRGAQAVQDRPPVHAAGRQEHRGRQRGAWRHRGGGEGRRDRIRLRAARFARGRPHPHEAARVPDADARRRDRAQAPRRRAADLRSPAPDDGGGSDADRGARLRPERNRAVGLGRPAPAIGAGTHGQPVQARSHDAPAAHPLSRDHHRAGRRATPGTRSRPAARASSARSICASSRCRAAPGSSSSTP